MTLCQGTWGGILPVEEVTVMEADPIDACSPLQTPYEMSNVVIVALRGGCSFGDKALNVQVDGFPRCFPMAVASLVCIYHTRIQNANGAALVVVETTDGAIQRIGATADQVIFNKGSSSYTDSRPAPSFRRNPLEYRP